MQCFQNRIFRNNPEDRNNSHTFIYTYLTVDTIKMLHSLSSYVGFKEDEEGKHCHEHPQCSGNVYGYYRVIEKDGQDLKPL
jgi:hypothetical protein